MAPFSPMEMAPFCTAVDRFGSVRLIESVKRYKPVHVVTAEEVQALLGVLHGDHQASKGILSTTWEFAPRIGANSHITQYIPHRLELVDGKALEKRLTGRFLAEWPGYPRADSIVLTRNGGAYVGTGKGDTRIYNLDLKGRLIAAFGAEATFGYPHGMFVDSEGSLYVADPAGDQASKPPRRFVKGTSPKSQ